MTLEKQVVSLELSKKLKELGVKQESIFYYWHDKCKFNLAPNIELPKIETICSTFTVAELGEIMSTHELTDANEGDSFTLKISSAIDFWCATFGNNDIDITPQIEDTSLADALAKMLIYLIENKLITL